MKRTCSEISLATVRACATTIALAILQIASSGARAATITDVNAAWPASPAVQSLDALNFTPANRGVHSARVNRQSLTVSSTVTVNTIYLSAHNYNNQEFIIRIFETATTSGTLVDGAQVGSTITVAAQGATAADYRNLKIDLTLAEQFTLTPKTSPEGYIVAISLPDTAITTPAFNWAHSNNGSNNYLGGRYRRDDGNQDANRDYGVALVGVPEPASLGLLLTGLAGIATLRRRARA